MQSQMFTGAGMGLNRTEALEGVTGKRVYNAVPTRKGGSWSHYKAILSTVAPNSFDSGNSPAPSMSIPSEVD